jgi:hypothetical protein
MSLHLKRFINADCYGGAEIFFPAIGLWRTLRGFENMPFSLVSAETCSECALQQQAA